MVSKSSIMIFYLRIAKTKQFFRTASTVVLIVAVVAGTALTLLNVFQCRPVSNTFSNPLPSNTKCIDIVTLYLSSAPVNILTDLAILFLPMPILTALCLPRKQKNILIATFGESHVAPTGGRRGETVFIADHGSRSRRLRHGG